MKRILVFPVFFSIISLMFFDTAKLQPPKKSRNTLILDKFILKSHAPYLKIVTPAKRFWKIYPYDVFLQLNLRFNA